MRTQGYPHIIGHEDPRCHDLTSTVSHDDLFSFRYGVFLSFLLLVFVVVSCSFYSSNKVYILEGIFVSRSFGTWSTARTRHSDRGYNSGDSVLLIILGTSFTEGLYPWIISNIENLCPNKLVQI